MNNVPPPPQSEEKRYLEQLYKQWGGNLNAEKSDSEQNASSIQVEQRNTPTIRKDSSLQRMASARKLVRSDVNVSDSSNRLNRRYDKVDALAEKEILLQPVFTQARPIVEHSPDVLAEQETMEYIRHIAEQGYNEETQEFEPETKKQSTMEILVAFPTKAIQKLEYFATSKMQVLKGVSQLDKFETVPVKAVQGLKTERQTISNIKLRLVGICFVGMSVVYIPWLFTVLNRDALWFSLPFFISMCYLTLLVLLSIYNNWTRVASALIRLPKGEELTVAVCIPTYGETPEMVQTTIESVLSQDWPHNRIVIIVGDDSHRPAMQQMVRSIQESFPLTHLIYHEPPRKGNPERKGSAKDGNLNSMLAYVTQFHPDIKYLETRDADDVVGSPQFLRYAVGHLVRNKDVAYVQTIKDTLVSEGDPFGNRQSFFYRGVMLARNAANSVFPCGSGLVWVKEKLDSIDGFPTWNLVEDLYSGYVAMQHGLKGSYVPVVGAIGQVSPEDIPNVYKQLGTWALDTTRIFFWKNPWIVKGLTFRQRMQFTELGLFYLFSFPLLIFLIAPIISLLTGVDPFIASNAAYVLHFWPYAACIEILLTFASDSTTFEETFRARQMWFGMIFVFIKSTFLALTYGPNKKPAYKVTRKTQEAGLYLREVFFQVTIFLLLLAAIIYNCVIHYGHILRDSDIGSIFWAVLYMIILAGIISGSWFGYRIKKQPEEKADNPKA